MHFDDQGHLIVMPRDIQEMAFADKAKLINTVLIPGTPRAVSTHAQHGELLRHISDKIGIHPNNLLFKGSTKIRFSIAPKAAKVWMEYGPASDLDMAIVDPGSSRLWITRSADGSGTPITGAGCFWTSVCYENIADVCITKASLIASGSSISRRSPVWSN
jgi:hypothetical protein